MPFVELIFFIVSSFFGVVLSCEIDFWYRNLCERGWKAGRLP
jgi:hypothetical protein